MVFLSAQTVFLVHLLELFRNQLLLSLEFFLMVEEFLLVVLIVISQPAVVVDELQFCLGGLYRHLTLLHHSGVCATSVQFVQLPLGKLRQLSLRILLLQLDFGLNLRHLLLMQFHGLVLRLLVSLVLGSQLLLLVGVHLRESFLGEYTAMVKLLLASHHLLLPCLHLLLRLGGILLHLHADVFPLLRNHLLFYLVGRLLGAQVLHLGGKRPLQFFHLLLLLRHERGVFLFQRLEGCLQLGFLFLQLGRLAYGDRQVDEVEFHPEERCAVGLLGMKPRLIEHIFLMDHLADVLFPVALVLLQPFVE